MFSRATSRLGASAQNRKDFDPPFVGSRLCSLHIIERGTNLFPLLFHEWPEGGSLFDDERKNARRSSGHFANLTDAALRYLTAKGTVDDAVHLFHHTVAILHAGAYAEENAGPLRQDWPRIPLPSTRDALLKSALLGQQVAALLDTDTAVQGITTGKTRQELKVIGSAARIGGGNLNISAGELDVTAHWAIIGKGGICMPSTGKTVERGYDEQEHMAIVKGADELGLTAESGFACLGEKTIDIYLNEVAFWRNVPAKVWEYRLGGYQVMKKWLSYREKSLLGRGLKLDEVTGVTSMARRIAALLLLQPALHANYEAVKADTFPWPT